jgi:hypothetical protein
LTNILTLSALGKLEIALRQDRALGQLSDAYVHRAVREDSLGFLIGRDAILANWVSQARAEVSIKADFGDMIAFEVRAGTSVWCGHRWVVPEDNRIIGETLVENRTDTKAAPPTHPPLGELRAGRGQYDAGDEPTLPTDFLDSARPLVTYLHKAWNGRALNLYRAPWLLRVLTTLPDATFYFERALQQGDSFAILWRVHGHHSNGQRVRLIGSSVMEYKDRAITGDMTILDFAALDAQLDRVLIDYA